MAAAGIAARLGQYRDHFALKRDRRRSGQAAHFDVATLSDDHGMVAVADQRTNGLVRDVHEWTGGLDYFESQCARLRQGALGRAVRRHHYRSCCDVSDVVGDGNAARLEVCRHGGVVYEVAEYGQRAFGRMFVRQGDRVAHAKAHAEMLGAEDADWARRVGGRRSVTLHCKVIIDSNRRAVK